MVGSVGNGHWCLRHAKVSFQTPEFQKMVVQGIQWAAKK